MLLECIIINSNHVIRSQDLRRSFDIKVSKSNLALCQRIVPKCGRKALF